MTGAIAYSLEEVAEILKCEPETVVERIVLGDIPGVKFGRGWIIPCVAFAQRLTEFALEEATARRIARPDPLRKPGKVIEISQARSNKARIPPTLPALPLRLNPQAAG